MNNNYNCGDCARQGCIHRDAFRRLPKSQGGLGLCPGRIDQPEPDTDARMEKLIFNKEKFLRTDFGKGRENLVHRLSSFYHHMGIDDFCIDNVIVVYFDS